jgi:hypothetical protein
MMTYERYDRDMAYQQLYWAQVVWCRGIRAVVGFNDGKVLAFVRT